MKENTNEIKIESNTDNQKLEKTLTKVNYIMSKNEEEEEAKYDSKIKHLTNRKK